MIAWMVILSVMFLIVSVKLLLAMMHDKERVQTIRLLREHVEQLEWGMRRSLEASREDFRPLVAFHAAQAGLADEDLLTPDDIRLLKKLQKSFSGDVYVSVEKLLLETRKMTKEK